MFNYEKFVNHAYSSYESNLSKEEINTLLELDNYEKDNPASIGKRLVINRLKIIGEKNSGDKINYDKKFYSGVNILFAGNSKGKSSIFKIIKFAITGDKGSVKKDVLSWLREIICEFSVGNTIYTIYINLEGKRIFSGLYRVSADNYLEQKGTNGHIENVLIHFETNTEKEFKEKIQQFFFDHFSYYNLKWTSGTKGTIDLIENETSWKTYYKSIYLESKDYNVLFLNQEFGGQNKKILEMILGLKLTYPINSLSQKHDYLKNIFQKMELIKTHETEATRRQELLEEVERTNEKISKINKSKKESFQKSISINRYRELAQQIKTLGDEIQDLESQKEELEKQLLQISKRIIRLEEEINFGHYFSNLEIKTCPRCEHEVSSEKKLNELEQHKCMLCDGDLEESDDEDIELTQTKIDQLKENEKKLKGWLEQINLTVKKDITLKEKYLTEIKGIEESINTFQFDESDLDELSVLIERKIELEYEIKKDDESNNSRKFNKIEEKVKILNSAIHDLISIRYDMSKDIIGSFEKLILKQLHKFGLATVSDVVVNEKLEIKFLQNGLHNNFSELNEGEQLRAKIAIFVSLILLDIEYGVGRHPRLLIIDSPGKEEVISKDLIGLSQIFKELEEEFEGDLQIIIGTALEELKEASNKYKVHSKKENEFVF
ncbi:hypothetical protein Q5W88_17665 [Shouchella clausii]|uniref:hypothetical protein n=1 Tax=Shouchella clausii TaxID=79880 RepID=UPI0026F43244|nr:hypothetical protein [Shouchella clausii]MDO7285097.1 hypothetical protein [Shouchella clausii]MDO7305035.1 hypothetical protein [Shouchella clausii]